MVKILGLNIDESERLFHQYMNILNESECYNNIMKLIAYEFLEEFTKGKIKIGFCYAGIKNYLVKHSVLIKDNKEIIDTTLFFNSDKSLLNEFIYNNNPQYYIFAEVDFKEYMKYIKLINGCNEFKFLLIDDEKEFLNYAKRNRLIINNRDWGLYMLPLLDKPLKNPSMLSSYY